MIIINNIQAEYPSNIGERIKFVRTSRNLTQKQFSETISITRECISNIERGVHIPSNAIIKLVSLSFKISETWIKTGNGEMTLSDASVKNE